MRFESKLLHEGYVPENGQPVALPIYQSTTYRYETTDYLGKLFDLSVPGHMYSRISNPTVELVEKKIAALEGGVGALCTTSGQTANFLALLNIMSQGDHIVSTAQIYGGTLNLLAATMKKMGIEVTFVDNDATDAEISAAFRPNTKALFGETLANPAISVLDIERFAKIAHEHDVPLIVDNTFPTPYLCRPIEWGADIVTHATTKYMDGHAVIVGGAVIDSGKFNWNNGKYPCLSEPDPTYHGLVYTEAFGDAAYITKMRVQLVRDLGVCPPAQAAWLLDLGLQTLAVRMDRHCSNAIAVAEYLEKHPKVEKVNYPGLKSDRYYSIAQKYLPLGCAGVISCVIAGGRDRAAKFLDSLKLAQMEVHVAEVHTCVMHPASGTHRQLSDEQLAAAGISPGLIRFSVGIENVDDIIEDIEQALAQV